MRISGGGGGGAPSGSSYVVIAVDGTLTAERALTGTSNQIIVTDGGAGGNVTLSLPQDIHTGASPTWTGATLSGMTQGSVLFAGASGVLSQDNANLFWDDTNNRLGIGLTAPLAPLHLSGDVAGVAAFDTWASSTQASGLIARKGRGSKASPEATAQNDNLGVYNARGAYNTGGAGTGVFSSQNSGFFAFRATETFTSTAQGALFVLGTAFPGTTSWTETLFQGVAKALTDASATNVLNLTNASNSTNGAILDYTIEATDGTDYQVETGSVYVSVANKSGAWTTTINEVNSQQALSAGTMTTTWAVSSANPAVVSVNADTSLAPSAGYPRITYHVRGLGRQSVSIP